MLNEWSDREPDPPMSRGARLALYSVLAAVAVLVWLALLGML